MHIHPLSDSVGPKSAPSFGKEHTSSNDAPKLDVELEMVAASFTTFALSADPTDVPDSFSSESEVFEIFGMSIEVVGVDEEAAWYWRLGLLQDDRKVHSCWAFKSSPVLFVACDKRPAAPLS